MFGTVDFDSEYDYKLLQSILFVAARKAYKERIMS